MKDEANLYKEESTGIRVVDIDDAENTDFPEGAIREWLFSIQNEKKRRNSPINEFISEIETSFFISLSGSAISK